MEETKHCNSCDETKPLSAFNNSRQKKDGKQYYRRHSDKVKAKVYRRKAAPGIFTPQQWADKCTYHGWQCIYCKTPLTPETATIEHRKPIVKGGSNWPANLAPACGYCNSAKRDLPEMVFKERLLQRMALC